MTDIFSIFTEVNKQKYHCRTHSWEDGFFW
jgi:hypothetical protein